MMSTNPQVWHTEKSKLRLAHSEDLGLNAVQIAGSDPLEMAQAAAILSLIHILPFLRIMIL